jgi:hypothetical protein
MGNGDQLASGGIRATYGPLYVSQEKWDSIFADGNASKVPNAVTHAVAGARKKARTTRKTTPKKHKG